MRKIGFTFMILIISYSASLAQTERGRWYVGTQINNLNYVENGAGESKRFSGSLLPNVGYFVARNLVVGAGIPFSLSSGRSQGAASIYGGYEAKSTIIGLGIAPFVRYYIGEAKLKPFLGLSYSYVSSNANYQSYTGVKSSAKGQSSAITPNLGLAYFINRKVAFNVALGYNVQSQNSSSLVSSSTNVDPGPVVTTKSLDFGLGFQYFFGK